MSVMCSPSICRVVVALAVAGSLAACAQDRAVVNADHGGMARPTLQPSDDARSSTPPAAPAVSLDGSPDLVLLLQTALERSPVIRAAQARARAAGEGAAVEGSLPNPQLLVGWYETSVETRVGPQEWSVGVRQEIPFPTKLDTKADIEISESRRMRIAYERAARDVLVEVVKIAHELAYIDEALVVSGEIGALLERYTTAAAAQETSSLVSELFRAETQRAQLDNDRVILAELRIVETQRMRSLLDLPVDAAIGTPRLAAAPDVRSSVPELLKVAERHNQELREAGIALETARLRASLAEQRYVPDMSVGVTSIRTDRLDSGLGLNPDGNGDDPLIVQFGLTLPIWLEKDAAAIRQARQLERAASLQRMDAIQQTRDRVARAWFQVGNAQRLSRLYADVLVPRAAVAARSAEDLLASGKGSVGGVLETIAVYHNFRLAAARARADHGRAIADLERAIGQPFEPLGVDVPDGDAGPGEER
jgi:outer membrane protein TolC